MLGGESQCILKEVPTLSANKNIYLLAEIPLFSTLRNPYCKKFDAVPIFLLRLFKGVPILLLKGFLRVPTLLIKGFLGVPTVPFLLVSIA